MPAHPLRPPAVAVLLLGAALSIPALASGTCIAGEGRPGVALLLEDASAELLAKTRPEVAAALGIIEWQGLLGAVVGADETAVSFLGQPTTATARLIRARGGESPFDATLAPLPPTEWVRVALSVSRHSTDRYVTVLATTIRMRAETVLDAQAPVVLSGPIAAFPLDGPGPGGCTALAATLRLQAN